MTQRSKIEDGQVLLRQEDARLVLDPAHGGAIREFSCLGHDVLRHSAAGAVDPFELACFAMVPYVNRIVDGRFACGAHSVQLQRNWSLDPHPLHGQGWRAPWQVAEVSGAEATLRFDGGGNEWPWRYRAEQHLRLSRSALTVRLSVENLSASPMPVMLGLHPYFGDAARATLEAHAPRVWKSDRAALPIEEVPAPPAWSFESGRRVAAVPLDNCFTQWDGKAVVRWSDRVLTLRATNCRFLHVFVPPGGDFFCMEPQTAATGAFNRDRSEVSLVQSGERFAIRVSLDLEVS